MTQSTAPSPRKDLLASVYHRSTELLFAQDYLHDIARSLKSIANRMDRTRTESVHIQGNDLHLALEHLDYLVKKLEDAVPSRKAKEIST